MRGPGHFFAGLRRGPLVAVGRGLVAVLLPAVCPLCGNRGLPEGGGPVCGSCATRLEPLVGPCCSRCALPFSGGGPDHPCPRCVADPPPFEGLRAWGPYRGALLEAIQRLKYGGDLALRRLLEDLAVDAVRRTPAVPGPDAVVPVPCTTRTLARRGFDLPALLARRVAREVQAPWRPSAVRKRPDAPDLVGMGAAERERATRRAFEPVASLAGTVLVVDDVVTTTATVRAVARACLAAGAGRVTVLALARTPLAPG